MLTLILLIEFAVIVVLLSDPPLLMLRLPVPLSPTVRIGTLRVPPLTLRVPTDPEKAPRMTRGAVKVALSANVRVPVPAIPK